APQSSLSRKTPEEEPRAEEVMVEEESLEEVPAEETAQEEVLEEASEVIPAEETEDLPQVKTFKFGQDSLEVEESEAPVVAEEVDEDASQASDGSDPVEKIKKAKELLDIGAITPEEFEEIKKKYLAMI
ncbi:MAG: SHOCT domain-containing protein, partial [Methanobacteriaceae archaeon]